jgi:hypothetical protein
MGANTCSRTGYSLVRGPAEQQLEEAGASFGLVPGGGLQLPEKGGGGLLQVVMTAPILQVPPPHSNTTQSRR